MLDQPHPLYQLAGKTGWGKLETAFQPLYCQDNGRPGKPIRLMCGLLILKHLRILSDESSVEQWSGNAYYQYFCSMQEFTPSVPCASSELVHFRKRIGEEGLELIFQESIRVNNEDNDSRHQRLKKHKLFRKRAGIEPSIGHLKSDYRLVRNFYKGVVGDAVDVLPAVAVYNFKRAMKVLLILIKNFSGILYDDSIPSNWTFLKDDCAINKRLVESSRLFRTDTDIRIKQSPLSFGISDKRDLYCNSTRENLIISLPIPNRSSYPPPFR